MRRKRIAEITYYEWSVARWLTSDTRALLDPAGRSIYRELLDLCYVQGSIPKDEELQARKADCTVEQIRRVWPVIKKHFHAHKSDHNLLVNDEANAFRTSFFRYISAQKNSGRRGGESKRARKPKALSEMSSDGLSHDGSQQQLTTTDLIPTNTTTTATRAPAAFEWPETAAAIRQYFPSADDPLVMEVVHGAVQAYVDAATGFALPPLTDSILPEAIHQAYFKKQESAGLFRTKVPRVVRTWVEQVIRGQATR